MTTSPIERKTVREWLEMPFQWRIPVYQRHYAWDPDNEYGPTHLFWGEVKKQAVARIEAMEENGRNPPRHYFGAVLVKDKPAKLQSIQSYDVVDGQQRLTTINVALFSLIKLAMKLGLGEGIKDGLEKYIFTDPQNKQKKDSSKLLPTNFDRAQFVNLLISAYPEADAETHHREDEYNESMVVQAYHFFNERFEKFVDAKRKDNVEIPLRALLDSLLDGFELIVIPLAETDKAQLIFESMNNTALPLTTFDLIRNYVFYRADEEQPGQNHDVKLFNGKFWQEFEQYFWKKPFNKKGDDNHIVTYVARMMLAKQRKLIDLKRESIFREYKLFAKGLKNKGIDVAREIKEISEYVKIYKYLVGEISRNPVVSDTDEELDFGYFKKHYKESVVFFPVLFTIATCASDLSEKQKMLKLLESWHVRKLICSSGEGINKIMPTICDKLSTDPSYETLEDYLKESSEDNVTRGFPNDKEVQSSLMHQNFYKRRKLAKYIFDCVVWDETSTTLNDKRDTSNQTIDHIFPQSWSDTDWEKVVEDYDDETVEEKINTLGNLTPLKKGTNTKKGNKFWGKSKGNVNYARYWLDQCDLQHTRKLASKKKWDIEEIDNRNKELAEKICKIWSRDIK